MIKNEATSARIDDTVCLLGDNKYPITITVDRRLTQHLPRAPPLLSKIRRHLKKLSSFSFSSCLLVGRRSKESRHPSSLLCDVSRAVDKIVVPIKVTLVDRTFTTKGMININHCPLERPLLK